MPKPVGLFPQIVCKAVNGPRIADGGFVRPIEGAVFLASLDQAIAGVPCAPHKTGLMFLRARKEPEQV